MSFEVNDDTERKRLLCCESTDETPLIVSPDPRDKDCKEAATYEEAIAATGYGRYHYLVLFLCGWAVSSDAVEVLSVSFMLPSAKCALHLSASDRGWLNAIIFFGMMVGGYFWGSLADHKGRRSILLWSLTVNGLGGAASSTAQVFWLFLLLRFISGIGVGGSIPVIFAYFTEFQPKSHRGMMIGILATFWMLGNIIAAGLAWIVIPQNIGFHSSYFTYDSWRIFVVLCTIPSLSSAAMFVLMPESPKFLLQAGRSSDALDVLKRVYRLNMRKSSDTYQVKSVVLSRNDDYKSVSLSEYTNTRCHRFWQLLDPTFELFRKPLLRTTTVLLIISFTLAFGYYGLWMWFPTLFSKVEENNGPICGNTHINKTSDNATEWCKPIDNWVYFEGFMTALSNLPGNLVAIFLLDRLGRKALLASSMVVSGVSVFFLWFVSNKVQNLLVACLFGAVSTVGWASLDVLQSELYPTNVRSTATGVMTGLMRIAAILGNVLFGFLVDVNCAVPMLLVAGLLSFGGLCAIKLPNTTKRDIH